MRVDSGQRQDGPGAQLGAEMLSLTQRVSQFLLGQGKLAQPAQGDRLVNTDLADQLETFLGRGDVEQGFQRCG